MKAIQIDQYGKEMHMRDVKRPEPTADQVLVKVRAVSLNPVDLEVRHGKMKLFTGSKFPRGMGVDFAGIVEVTGSDVKHLEKGDEVFGWVSYKMSNTIAEYCIAKAELTVRKPSALSFEEAACLGMVGCTAYKSLVEKGGLIAGMKVLINGSTGGVGHLATQIAKAAGAEVHGITSPTDQDLARELGADRVFDYTQDDITAAGEQYDLVFDTPGMLGFPRAKQVMKSRSIYVTTKPGGSQMGALITNLFSGRKNKMVITSAKPPYLKALQKLGNDGHLKVIVGKTTPFEQAIEAIRFFEEGGKARGKQVISMS